MSQWTHINASIRFDGIRGMMPMHTEETMEKYEGRISSKNTRG